MSHLPPYQRQRSRWSRSGSIQVSEVGEEVWQKASASLLFYLCMTLLGMGLPELFVFYKEVNVAEEGRAIGVFCMRMQLAGCSECLLRSVR